jgi:hypothetical protein
MDSNSVTQLETDHNSPSSHSAAMTNNNSTVTNKRKEIYTYEAPWTTYSMAFCRREASDSDMLHQGKFKLAVGSYIVSFMKYVIKIYTI